MDAGNVAFAVGVLVVLAAGLAVARFGGDAGVAGGGHGWVMMAWDLSVILVLVCCCSEVLLCLGLSFCQMFMCAKYR